MPAALLLVDVVNGFDFPNSEELTKAAKEVAPRIADLAVRAREFGLPVIYVNDNFGMWQSDFRAVVHECSKPERPGHRVTRALAPVDGDHFVLKPRHSGFLATPLELLLDHLGIGSLIVAGFATDLCVLFTVLDAHTRGFRLAVPRDCTAANGALRHEQALSLVESSLKGSVAPAASLDLAALDATPRRDVQMGAGPREPRARAN